MDTTTSQNNDISPLQEPLLSQEGEQAETTDAVIEEQSEHEGEELDEFALEDEIEDELIIEDFTIDGICGVY